VRILAIVLLSLIAALQYPLWLGKGGWLQVRDLDRALASASEANAALKARNEALDADVRDLKTGYEAIEERARSELGMVRNDEVFFQLRSDPLYAGSGASPLARGTPLGGLSNAAASIPIER
jgi:cell division protein FtsB